MLQLDNDTPLAAALAALPDEDGVDALFVCVKATFTMRPTVALAAQQLAIARVDLHVGEPNASSLIEAGEHHLGKAGTDVVLHGCAHAEGGRAVTQAAVSVAVAERSKSIAVFGDREFRSLDRVSSPAPFVALPLVYERALGGRVGGGDAWVRELSAHNPVGVGIDRRAGAPPLQPLHLAEAAAAGAARAHLGSLRADRPGRQRDRAGRRRGHPRRRAGDRRRRYRHGGHRAAAQLCQPGA